MRVFLVDDEFLQRALVKKTVDWNSLGMEICGEAEDGEEALKKILEEKPPDRFSGTFFSYQKIQT